MAEEGFFTKRGALPQRTAEVSVDPTGFLRPTVYNPGMEPVLIQPGTRYESKPTITKDFIVEQFQLKKKKCLKDPQRLKMAMELLMKHKDVFSFCGEYGYTHYMEHRIKLKPGAQPLVVPQKPFNPALSKIVEQKTQEMLKDKVIEPTKLVRNMWNSWVVLVTKKAADGNWLDIGM